MLTLLLLFLFIPFMMMMFFFNIVTFSFTNLGLSPEVAFLLMMGCLIGSMINIPLGQQDIEVKESENRMWGNVLFYTPPHTAKQTIYINVGGALIPTAFSLYLLLTRAPIWPALIATVIMAVVSRLLARPVPGVGIALPVFIPPLLAAILALLISPHNPASVAYISGVLGTLIGADLLNYPRFKDLGSQAISIGGAGVFDGIFLVGIVAAFLT